MSTEGAASPEYSLYGCRQRLKTEFQTFRQLNSPALALKIVICVYELLTKSSHKNIIFQYLIWKHGHCVFYVSKKSLIEQHQTTPYSLNITNDVSMGYCSFVVGNHSLDISKVIFATIINSSFHAVFVAGHADFSIIWSFSRDESLLRIDANTVSCSSP